MWENRIPANTKGEEHSHDQDYWLLMGTTDLPVDGQLTGRARFDLSLDGGETSYRVEILEETDGPVAPQAWNQFEPSSKGYACDWTDANKGEKYKL